MQNRTKLYIFPAFLPLAAVIPWLLTGVGAVAGLALGIIGRKRSKAALFGGGVLLTGALAFAAFYLSPYFFWWLHQNESRLTPYSSLPTTTTFQPEPVKAPSTHQAAWARWKPQWSATLGHRPLSRSHAVGNLIVFGTWEKTVDAHDLESGALLWSLRKKEPVVALTKAGENLLLAGEGLHNAVSASLTAIRLPDGKALWEREFPGHIEVAPAFSQEQNKIWLGAGPGGVWCLDSRYGSVLWHKPVGHVDSTPLLQDGVLYLLAQENEAKPESIFLALRAADGEELWRTPLPGQPWGNPVPSTQPGHILITSGTGQIGDAKPTDRGWAHSVSVEQRKLSWSSPLPGNPLETTLVLKNAGLAVYTVTNGEILALNATSGLPAWQLKAGDPIVAESALDQSQAPPVLAAITLKGKLLLVNALNGSELDSHSFQIGGSSGPIFLTDGMIVPLQLDLHRFRR